MKLTRLKVAKDRILSAIDHRDQKAIYRMLLAGFGLDRLEALTEGAWTNDYSDGIYRFSDITPSVIESGRHNLIQNSARIAMARLFAKDIEAKHVGIDPMDAEVRKATFQHDYDGDEDIEPGFSEESQFSFLDGDNIGCGCTVFDLVRDTFSGKLRTYGEHVPRLQLVYDPLQRSPLRSRWFAYWQYYEVDEVARTIGWKQANKNKQTAFISDDGERLGEIEYVRVLNYRDVGHGTGDPTHIRIFGSLEDGYIERSENGFGSLPAAWSVGFVAPGSRNPHGRLRFEMSNQEMAHEIFDYFKEVLDNPPRDIYDPNLFDSDEWQRLEDGNMMVKGNLKSFSGGVKPHYRVPGLEVPQSLMLLYNMVTQQIAMDSNLAEFDRAQTGSTQKSATEIAVMDKRMSMNMALSIAQTARFQKRLIVKHAQVCALGDEHPRTLNVYGSQVPVNVEGEPHTNLENYFRDRSNVVIDVESMTADENQLKLLQTRESLKALKEMAGDQIDPRWFAEEVLRTTGDYDPDVALLDEGDMAQRQAELAAQTAPPIGIRPGQQLQQPQM